MQHNLTLFKPTLFALSQMLATALFLTFGLSPSTAQARDDLGKVLLSQPAKLPEFALSDTSQKTFTRDRFDGKWSFVFFGYTHCPDVCPVTLTEMDKIIELLPPGAPPDIKYQYVFITVDPARDTLPVMSDYVHYFNHHIIGVTGDPRQVRNLADAVNIRFSRGPGTSTEYSMNHGSAMVLIDPKGRYYARFRAPHYADRIFQLFREIRRHFQSTNTSTSKNSNQQSLTRNKGLP